MPPYHSLTLSLSLSLSPLSQPAVPLKHSSRYIVAVQNIRNENNEVIGLSDLFTYFRDGIEVTPKGQSDQARKARYDESIFPVLASHK